MNRLFDLKHICTSIIHENDSAYSSGVKISKKSHLHDSSEFNEFPAALRPFKN